MCSVGISVVFRGHCHCVPWALPLYSMGIAIVFMSIAIVFMGITIVFMGIAIVSHGCCLCIPWTSVLCYVGIGIVFHGHSHSVRGHWCCVLWTSALYSVGITVVSRGRGCCVLWAEAEGHMLSCRLSYDSLFGSNSISSQNFMVYLWLSGFEETETECFVLISSTPTPEFIT